MTDKEKAEDFFKTYFRIDDDEYEFAKKDSETTISLMVGFAQKENKDLQHRLDVAQGFLDRDTEYNKLLEVINNQDVKIADLEKQIKVLTQNLEDTEIYNKALEKKVEAAKQIIKRLLSLYFYPVVTDKDLKRKDEIIEQAEQFIGVEK